MSVPNLSQSLLCCIDVSLPLCFLHLLTHESEAVMHHGARIRCQHVLQDSLTSGMCACSCDGVHFPLIMPALIVQLAAKIGRLLNASGSSSRRLAETPLPPPYGFAASERFEARTLEWTGYERRPAKQQLVCK